MIADVLRKWLGRIWPARGQPGDAAVQPSGSAVHDASVEIARAVGYELEAVGPADGNLLEQARLQWQRADWLSLADLSERPLVHHPDRAKLALLAGSAKLQLGDQMAARSLLRQSAAWGCDARLMARILVAGVHNTLARTAVLMALEEDRVRSHFKQALEGAGHTSSLTQHARIAIETYRLETSIAVEPLMSSRGTSPVGSLRTAIGRVARGRSVSDSGGPDSAKGCPAALVRKLAVHDLGMGWASNTVNTVIFRHHGILTDRDFQFTAFYVDETALRIVRRTLLADEVVFYDLVGGYNLADAHNSISLGIDSDGYLHMSYDHHADRLRYRRSLLPWDICEWSEELAMTGIAEDRVTYPCFIQSSPTQPVSPLMLLFRDGNSNRGTARINVYDTATSNWTVLHDALLSGADQKPWTSNPYWNHPVAGSDGSLHLSFVWRTDSIGKQALINNINIGYAKSLDGGLTWLTSRNQPYRLPITQVNAETAHPVSPGSNLINQCSMALDSANLPHIVFYADDQNGIPQYQHVWLDGKRWRHHVISSREENFNLQGTGTLQIPISRPEILIDQLDQAFILLRGDLTNDRMAVFKLRPPDYLFDATATATLWDEDLGYAEPIIDRVRWQRDEVLTMLIQHNHQPHGDVPAGRNFSAVSLVDYQLT